jgi:hypothetical protein
MFIAQTFLCTLLPITTRDTPAATVTTATTTHVHLEDSSRHFYEILIRPIRG